MNYLVALFVGVAVYAIVDFALSLVPKLAPHADRLSLVAGALGALLYLGVLA